LVALQAASACSLATLEGTGVALMTSTHTSLAALRAPARSPLAALSQIPSTLVFVLAESVGAALITALQDATAACTPTLLAAPLEVIAGDVEVVPEAAGMGGAAVEMVWLLDVEVLLLPQPATNAPPTATTASHANSLRIIESPIVGRTFAHRPFGRPAPVRSLNATAAYGH
jgi:hypothetical protein